MVKFNSYFFSLEEMRRQATEHIVAISKDRKVNLLENEFEPEWRVPGNFIYRGLALRIQNNKLVVEFEGTETNVDYADLTVESLMWLADIIE